MKNNIRIDRENKKSLALSIVTPMLLLATSAVATNTSSISTDSTGINLNKSDGDTAQNIRIQPTKDGIKSFFSLSDKQNYQLDIGAYYESNKAKNDIVLDASYRMLHESAKLGTYIGIAKGSELEKFVLSQGFALEKGRVKVSAALLRRLTLLDFSEYSQSFKEKLTQKSLGAEYSYAFNRDTLLQELKTSITYYNLENKEIGKIGDIIVDSATLYDWTRVYGGYRGGTKVLVEATAVLKLSDAIKASLSLGYDRLAYKAMYDQNEEISTKLSSSISLAYRLNDYHQLESYAKNQNSQKMVGAKYSHDFGNAFSGYISAEKLHRDYAPSDTQYRFGISYSFGTDEKHTRLSSLFAQNSVSSVISLSELSPIAAINSDNFAISPKKVIYNEHIARVDKTALAAGDGITLASDGTLSNIYFDNGGFTVLSIDTVNDSSYLPYLGIVGGKLAVINITALNTHMASQGLTTGQTKTLNVAVSDTSGGGTSLYAITITKGSVEIRASVQRAYNVTQAQKAAFMANTKTITQVNAENANAIPTANDFAYATAIAHLPRTFSWLALSSAADNNGDALNAVIQTQGTKGTAVINGNNITYTPSANKSGSDTVTLTISDGRGGTKNIIVTLNGINTTVAVKSGNIVTDYVTGLQWQDDSSTGGYTHSETWDNAITYCSNLSLDGQTGWRLPTITELETILDTNNYPAFKTGFTNSNPSLYWSITDSIYGARTVLFTNGIQNNYSKANAYSVRCVR
ncbi:MAG: DUF1566 domain-containing protein [Campylobacterales bacterium]|nr:DUF1566 domain-containing protein [Campylobacterales bacterium]